MKLPPVRLPKCSMACHGSTMSAPSVSLPCYTPFSPDTSIFWKRVFTEIDAPEARNVSKVSHDQIIRQTTARGKLCTPPPQHWDHSFLLVENLVDKWLAILLDLGYSFV